MAGTWWKDIDELKAEQSSLLDIDPDTNLLIKASRQRQDELALVES